MEAILSYHLLNGILKEKEKADPTVDYVSALVLSYAQYGDPRGRGALSHPIQMFLAWRLGLHSRKNKEFIEAEYFDETFDACMFSGPATPMNAFMKLYDEVETCQIFNQSVQVDDQKQLDVICSTNKRNIDEDSHISFRLTSDIGRPYSHWTSHKNLFTSSKDSSGPITALIWASLFENPKMMNTLLESLPCLSSNYSMVTFTSVKRIVQEVDNKMTSILGDRLMNSNKPQSRNQLSRYLSNHWASATFGSMPGYVFSWGSNSQGQIGSIASAEEIAPLLSSKPFNIYSPRILLPLKNIHIKFVTCGHAHSIAILASGVCLGWGSNQSGQLGLGEGAPKIVQIPSFITGISDVVKISCGSEHSIALLRNNKVYSWGQGEGGLLGLGTQDSKNTPTLVNSLEGVTIADIVCGGLHNIVLTSEGEVFTWGRGEGGQLGHNISQLEVAPENEIFLCTPTKIEKLAQSTILQITAGDAHSLALDSKGKLFAWGFSSSGQLGLGITADNHTLSNSSLQIFEPTAVPHPRGLEIKKVWLDNKIFSGQTFSFFIDQENKFYGFGINDFYQLGAEFLKGARNHQSTDVSEPKLVEQLSDKDITSLASGANHSLALIYSNCTSSLLVWGANRQGQLGLQLPEATSSLPKPVKMFSKLDVSSISAGAYHSQLVVGGQFDIRQDQLGELWRKLSN